LRHQTRRVKFNIPLNFKEIKEKLFGISLATCDDLQKLRGEIKR